MKTESLATRMEPELFQWIKEKAKKNHTTASHMLRLIVFEKMEVELEESGNKDSGSGPCQSTE